MEEEKEGESYGGERNNGRESFGSSGLMVI
jgi:hypothetical protein